MFKETFRKIPFEYLFFSFIFLVNLFLFLYFLIYGFPPILYLFPDPVHIFGIFLLVLFAVIVLLFYLYNKLYFFAILRDIRLLRISYFELMFFLGLMISGFSGNISLDIGETSLLGTPVFFLAVISVFWACLFSLMTNNIIDQDIDRITNRDRPLIKKDIPLDAYRKIAWFALPLSLIYALAVNIGALFFISLFIGNYFLYSIPPLRLKRVLFFSKMAPALNTLVMIFLGLSLAGNDPGVFPGEFVIYFLLSFTALINFIDIKDYEGDKAAGIKTIPVVFGLERGKLLIASFFLIFYAVSAGYFSLEGACFYIFIATGFIQFLFIKRRNYWEKPVLIISLLSIVFFIFVKSGI